MKKTLGLFQKAPKLYSPTTSHWSCKWEFLTVCSHPWYWTGSVPVPLTLRLGSGVDIGVDSKGVRE